MELPSSRCSLGLWVSTVHNRGTPLARARVGATLLTYAHPWIIAAHSLKLSRSFRVERCKIIITLLRTTLGFWMRCWYSVSLPVVSTWPTYTLSVQMNICIHVFMYLRILYVNTHLSMVVYTYIKTIAEFFYHPGDCVRFLGVCPIEFSVLLGVFSDRFQVNAFCSDKALALTRTMTTPSLYLRWTSCSSALRGRNKTRGRMGKSISYT